MADPLALIRLAPSGRLPPISTNPAAAAVSQSRINSPASTALHSRGPANSMQ